MLLVVDECKQVRLGDLACHGQYVGVLHADGTITLTPARVVTEERFHELIRAEQELTKIRDIDWEDPPF